MKYEIYDGVMYLYTDDGREIKYDGELKVEVDCSFEDLNWRKNVEDIVISDEKENFQILRLLKRLVNAQDKLYIAINELDEDIIDEDIQDEVNEIHKNLGFLISDILEDVEV